MLGIILCDDDKFILGIEKEKIQEIIEKKSLGAYIACTSTSYKEVIQFLEKNAGSWLCFVDLDFGRGRLNGIDIAKLIKKVSLQARIVFVTNHHEMALKVLKSGVEPFGFIEKSTDMAGMKRSYQRYIQLALGAEVQPEQQGDADTICLTPGAGEEVVIPITNILYVESVKTVSHCICYHTLDHSAITVRDTIDHAQELLGESFIRSHRSVLVNKKYIVGIENGNVKFASGETAACSFRQRNVVKGVLHDQSDCT